MRCPYCGNENPGQNRFCGMCGRPLLAEAAQTGTGPSSNASAGILGATYGNSEAKEERQSDVPGSQRTGDAIPRPPEPSPAYTGGLFHLGSTDDRHPRNLDYLLEDDEKPRSWGGVFVVVLLAAALAGGIGWLRWRNGGLPGVANAITETDSSGTKPSAESSTSTEHGSAESTQPQPTPAASPGPATAPAANSVPAPNSGIPETPAITQVTPEPSAAAEHAAQTSDGKPQGIEDAAPAAHSEPSASPAPAAVSTPPPAPPVPKPEPSAHSPAKPAASSVPAPAPKVAPVVKQDPVVLGEKYLYGRGVSQSCEKGLHLVKSPADQGNPKAMITMGALYATGHCVGRDLPTAYRFFALALRKDPDNAALKQNAEMVWSQMTPTERQHAIQLTQ